MGHEVMFISPELVNVWFVAAVPEVMKTHALCNIFGPTSINQDHRIQREEADMLIFQIVDEILSYTVLSEIASYSHNVTLFCVKLTLYLGLFFAICIKDAII